jgi:hypothetical protein
MPIRLYSPLGRLGSRACRPAREAGDDAPLRRVGADL